MNQRRNGWLFAGIIGVLAALVFLWWAIQTAWLGSFPGRDVEAYSRWAIVQFALCVAFLLFAIVAFVRFKRGAG
jgi:hypothetical protein